MVAYGETLLQRGDTPEYFDFSQQHRFLKRGEFWCPPKSKIITSGAMTILIILIIETAEFRASHHSL